jgi:hypothetical protein
MLLLVEATPSMYTPLLCHDDDATADDLRYVTFAWKDPQNIVEEINNSKE